MAYSWPMTLAQSLSHILHCSSSRDKPHNASPILVSFSETTWAWQLGHVGAQQSLSLQLRPPLRHLGPASQSQLMAEWSWYVS